MSRTWKRLLTGTAISAVAYFLLEDHASAADRSKSKKGSIPAGAAHDYIKRFLPFAISTQQYYSVPAIFTIAQGGLESRWGTSNVAHQANNHFGIKADKNWKGAAYSGYRSYGDVQSSYNDHGKFLATNPKYAPAFRTSDPIEFARAVAAAEYAEDPEYAQKLTDAIRIVQKLV